MPVTYGAHILQLHRAGVSAPAFSVGNDMGSYLGSVVRGGRRQAD